MAWNTHFYITSLTNPLRHPVAGQVQVCDGRVSISAAVIQSVNTGGLWPLTRETIRTNVNSETLGQAQTWAGLTTSLELQISKRQTRMGAHTHTHTHVHRQESGFKWWEKSLCHGSMMDHYGWVTSTGKKKLIEQSGLKVQGQGSRKGESRIQSPTIRPCVICFQSLPFPVHV